MDESRKEMAERVARHQADKEVEHGYTTSVTDWCSWFERRLPLSSLFVLFFSFLALILRVFIIICFSSFSD